VSYPPEIPDEERAFVALGGQGIPRVGLLGRMWKGTGSGLEVVVVRVSATGKTIWTRVSTAAHGLDVAVLEWRRLLPDEAYNPLFRRTSLFGVYRARSDAYAEVTLPPPIRWAPESVLPV